VENSIGIGDLAALIAGAGVAIYVLGLIGLAIPIRRMYTNDLSTAWYAASLVPRTVVAGQGVRIWLQRPTLSTLGVLLVLIAVQATLSQIPKLLGTVVLALLAGFISHGWYATPESTTTRREFLDGVLVGAFVWLMLLLVFGQLSSAIQPGSGIPPDLENVAALVRAIVFSFVASFVAQLRPATTAAPPLPTVRITRQDTEPEEETIIEGALVAHSDGFWHLFNEHSELLSIPDEKVLEARTGGKALTSPA
jgi:hypothetical protein